MIPRKSSTTRPPLRSFAIFLLGLLVLTLAATQLNFGPSQAPVLNAQDPDLPPATSPSTEVEYDRATKDEYDRALQQWRANVKSAAEATIRFYNSGRGESEHWRDQYDANVEEGKQHLARLVPLALKLFAENEQSDQELNELVQRIGQSFYEKGDYEKAYELGHELLRRQPKSSGAKLLIGLCTVLTNRFDEGADFFSKSGALLQQLPDDETDTEYMLFADIAHLKKKYQRELDLRKKESAADDLPRVQLKTTKGTIVLELFENEAPDTVGNFISLVEAKHYDGKIFHRVINKFMAQVGIFNDDRSFDQVGYTIYDECLKPEARHHFRGVVSMAKTNKPNSGSAQFFITMVPTPMLDEKHTVFGRIISGMEAVDRLNRTVTYDKNEDNKEVPVEGVVPDTIISATVLRKRDHDYLPNKVKTD